MPATTGQQMRRAGFSLVELTIVMLIMGILAAVTAPRYFEAINRFRVEAAAKRIAADLNLARAKANSKGGAALGEWVSFYSISDYYKMHNDPDIDHPENEYVVDLTKTAYPVDLTLAIFTNTSGYTSITTVKYDIHGRACSGLPPLFPDAPLALGQILVQSGSEQRGVVINPVTGIASVP